MNQALNNLNNALRETIRLLQLQERLEKQINNNNKSESGVDRNQLRRY